MKNAKQFLVLLLVAVLLGAFGFFQSSAEDMSGRLNNKVENTPPLEEEIEEEDKQKFMEEEMVEEETEEESSVSEARDEDEEIDDMDGDGVPDDEDNCPNVANPTQYDEDMDGFGWQCDVVSPYAPLDLDPCAPDPLSAACVAVDADADAVAEYYDNCPSIYNPDQADADGDGVGDACDIVDSDGDGVPDDEDNCVNVANPTQYDEDMDGFGWQCDVVSPYGPLDLDPCAPDPSVPACTSVDADADAVPEYYDNCPSVYNPDQADADGDGVGDACESS